MDFLEESSPVDDSLGLLPLIDVLLVTLLFFLRTYSMEGQIPLPLPGSEDQEASTSHLITITMTLDGQLQLDGETIRQEQLVDRLKQSRPESVLVRAHRDVPIQRVVGVRDLCQQAEVKKFALAVQGS